MRITKTKFENELQGQIAEITKMYNEKVEGNKVEITEIMSNIINIFDETGIAKVEFDEKSPLEAILKDTYTVTNIDEENKVISFKETNGEMAMVITI